jgi:hypothetical protein
MLIAGSGKSSTDHQVLMKLRKNGKTKSSENISNLIYTNRSRITQT